MSIICRTANSPLTAIFRFRTASSRIRPSLEQTVESRDETDILTKDTLPDNGIGGEDGLSLWELDIRKRDERSDGTADPGLSATRNHNTTLRDKLWSVGGMFGSGNASKPASDGQR